MSTTKPILDADFYWGVLRGTIVRAQINAIVLDFRTCKDGSWLNDVRTIHHRREGGNYVQASWYYSDGVTRKIFPRTYVLYRRTKR